MSNRLDALIQPGLDIEDFVEANGLDLEDVVGAWFELSDYLSQLKDAKAELDYLILQWMDTDELVVDGRKLERKRTKSATGVDQPELVKAYKAAIADLPDVAWSDVFTAKTTKTAGRITGVQLDEFLLAADETKTGRAGEVTWRESLRDGGAVG